MYNLLQTAVSADIPAVDGFAQRVALIPAGWSMVS
jgi:hypothetical protein